MKKVLVAGYYGYQNSGDDAILHSICNDILELDIETSITVLSNQPQLTMREYPVFSVNRFNLHDVLREIRSCDVLVMGGGSLIQDATSTRSLYYYLFLIWSAKIHNKSVMLYGNGIGPIHHWYNKSVTKYVLNKVDTITLREHLSKEVLNKLGVKKPLIQITADPVFNLEISRNNAYQEIYDSEGIPKDKPLVGVMFRSWMYEDSYTKKMAKICDAIVDKYDYHIVFVPMKYPSDLVVSLEIMKKMKHDATVIENRYNEEKLICLMGDLELILSMRLHALIYGALNNIPMLGFNYDPKVEYYAEELKIKYVKSMRHIRINQVMEQIDEIIKNKEGYKDHLREQAGKLKLHAKENRKYLQDLL
jgi:polysaccharide pyruvyl transferase CsaB